MNIKYSVLFTKLLLTRRSSSVKKNFFLGG